MTDSLRPKINKPLFEGSRQLWIVYGLFIVVSALSVTSALGSEVYSSGGLGPIFKHFFFLFLGFISTLIVSQIPPIWFRKATLPYSAMVVMMCVMLLFFGVELNGATRWINIAGLSVQPSEFFKLCLILWGAIAYAYSGQYPERSYKNFLTFWLVSAPFVVFFAKDNLSTGAIFGIFVLLYSLILKAPLRLVVLRGLLPAIAFVIVGGATLYFTPKDALAKVAPRAPTWQARMHSMFEDKENDPNRFKLTDKNLQSQLGQIAIARSNLLVHGPGSSKIRNSLPMAYSDFIYAIIIEEYGIIGLLLVPGLYMVWYYYAGRLARNERNRHRRALLLGIGLMFPMQALINIAVVAGKFMTGQPLPMISYGGSSILVCSIAMGMMLSISRVQNEIQALELEAKSLPES